MFNYSDGHICRLLPREVTSFDLESIKYSVKSFKGLLTVQTHIVKPSIKGDEQHLIVQMPCQEEDNTYHVTISLTSGVDQKVVPTQQVCF